MNCEDSICRIANQDIPVKEYQGQRVVTFREIDRVHKRQEGTAKRNFNANKANFIEGKDFFLLKRGDSLKYEFRTLEIPNRGLTLITESGYLMLCKSFGDKLAWDVQRKLVDVYFHKKEEFQPEKSASGEYQFTSKEWHGKQVCTCRDVEHFTGKASNRISSTVRESKSFKLGTHYWVLRGEDLAEFKQRYPEINPSAPWIMIISKEGYEKLAKKIPNAPPELPWYADDRYRLNDTPPVLARVNWAKKMVLDIPENPEIQKKINALKDNLTAMNVFLTLFNRFISQEDFDMHVNMLRQINAEIFLTAQELSEVHPNLVEKHI